VFAEFTGKLQAPADHACTRRRLPRSSRSSRNYRRKVEAAGSGKRLVQRAVVGAGHCGIDSGSRERAFDDLLAWMESGVAPRGDDLSGDLGRLGR
jgi:hypothetical protein